MTTTYRGWTDSDKKYALTDKLADAIWNYHRVTATDPTVALVNPADSALLADTERIKIRPVPWIPANTFYVGVEVDGGGA